MPKSVSTKLITLVLVFAASLNLGWDFYQEHQERIEREKESAEFRITVCTFGPAIDVRARMFIELFLILAFVGSLMKGFKNMLLSVLGLSGATLIYLLWRQVYFQVAEASGSDMKYVEHIGNLWGANYLDIAIAVTIAYLILVHLRHAMSRFRPTIDLA
jgi:hypothetical protein